MDWFPECVAYLFMNSPMLASKLAALAVQLKSLFTAAALHAGMCVLQGAWWCHPQGQLAGAALPVRQDDNSPDELKCQGLHR
jgi:hypothetical protein